MAVYRLDIKESNGKYGIAVVSEHRVVTGHHLDPDSLESEEEFEFRDTIGNWVIGPQFESISLLHEELDFRWYSAEQAGRHALIFLECRRDSGKITENSIIERSKTRFYVSGISLDRYVKYQLLKMENRVGILFRGVVLVRPIYDVIESIYDGFLVARRGAKYQAFKPMGGQLISLGIFLSTWDRIKKKISRHATVDDETFARVHARLEKGR